MHNTVTVGFPHRISKMTSSRFFQQNNINMGSPRPTYRLRSLHHKSMNVWFVGACENNDGIKLIKEVPKILEANK